MSVIFAAIRKDVLLLLRDRGTLISMFILPVVFIAMFGAMFADNDDPGEKAAKEIVEAVAGTPQLFPDSFQVSVPGNAVLFGFFIALTVAMAFVEDRKSGIWRRALAAPMSRSALLVSKLVPYLIIGLVQMAILFAIGVFAFGMRISGSVLALGAHTFAVVLCAVSLGLLMSSFTATEKQLGGIGSVLLLVMGLLGGAMVPRFVMPEGLRDIGLGVPHSWALDGYYELLIHEGAGLTDIYAKTGAVLGFAVAFAIAGTLLFKFER